MTTAHRPTYNPTRGGNIQGGNKLYNPSQQYSSKDLPGNLTLKKRKPGQGANSEIKTKDFKRELMERENKLKNKYNLNLVSSIYEEEESNYDHQSNLSKIDLTSDLLDLDTSKKKQRLDSFSEEKDFSEIKSHTSNNNISLITGNENDFVFLQDKDDEFSEDERDKENVSNKQNDYNEDEDTEEELYREYEKIKKMREEENKKLLKEQAEIIKQQTQEQVLIGNPLLNTGSYSLKKKWFEDTVFKNQAKNEPKIKKRFVNDTVRSDFHRKFLSKSVQ
jgi:protein CWC15